MLESLTGLTIDLTGDDEFSDPRQGTMPDWRQSTCSVPVHTMFSALKAICPQISHQSIVLSTGPRLLYEQLFAIGKVEYDRKRQYGQPSRGSLEDIIGPLCRALSGSVVDWREIKDRITVQVSNHDLDAAFNNDSAGTECAICIEFVKVPMQTPCRHMFCRFCIIESLKRFGRCPICQAPAAVNQLKSSVHLGVGSVEMNDKALFLKELIEKLPCESVVVLYSSFVATTSYLECYLTRNCPKVSIGLGSRNVPQGPTVVLVSESSRDDAFDVPVSHIVIMEPPINGLMRMCSLGKSLVKQTRLEKAQVLVLSCEDSFESSAVDLSTGSVDENGTSSALNQVPLQLLCQTLFESI